MLGAFLLILPFGALFAWVGSIINHRFVAGDFLHILPPTNLYIIIPIALVTIIMHEVIHGLCDWVLSQSRPEFGFKLHPYTKLAPGVYISRDRGLLYTLAPAITVSLLGLIAIPHLSSGATAWTFLVITVNAAASCGDYVVAMWLLRQPRQALWGAEGVLNVVYERTD